MSRKRVRRYCLPPLLCATAVVAALFSWPASVRGGMMSSTRFCCPATSARDHDGYSPHVVAANHRRRNIATHDVAWRRSSNAKSATDKARAVENVVLKDNTKKTGTTTGGTASSTISWRADNNDEWETAETSFRCYKIKYTTPKTTTERWSPKLKKCNAQSSATTTAAAAVSGSSSSSAAAATMPAKNSTVETSTMTTTTTTTTTTLETSVKTMATTANTTTETTVKATAGTTESAGLDDDGSDGIKADNNRNEYPPCGGDDDEDGGGGGNGGNSGNSDGSTGDCAVKASKSPCRRQIINQVNIVPPRDWLVPPRYRKPSPVTAVSNTSTAAAAISPPQPPAVKPKRKTRTFSADRHAAGDGRQSRRR